MTQRKPARRRPPARHAARLAGLALTLAAGMSLHSCAELPGERELAPAGARLQVLLTGLGTAVRQQAGQARLPGAAPTPAPVSPSTPVGSARTAGTNGAFAACPQFFAGGQPPVVKVRPSQRALCYDAFAILHSGESKTAVFVAQKLNRALVEDADEERGNRFFADARLPQAERAALRDYEGSSLDRGYPSAGEPDAYTPGDGAELYPRQHGAPGAEPQPGRVEVFGRGGYQKVRR